jgi:hypothetical protein
VIAGSIAALILVGGAFGAAVVTGVITLWSSSPVAAPVQSPSPSPSPTETPVPPPVYQPNADAAANQEYFDYVVEQLLATTPEADGRTVIDALIAGGFARDQMQVTFDRTNVDLVADSVQFSVRFDTQCLVGQNGAAAGGYSSAVLPVLGSGTCLVGATRQIDW